MKGNYNAMDIAFRLIELDKSNKHGYTFQHESINRNEDTIGYDTLNYYKLTEILYIAQGLHLALYDVPLFKDDIYVDYNTEPRINAIHEVFGEYIKSDRDITLELEKSAHLNTHSIVVFGNTDCFIENVYNNFASLSNWKLHSLIINNRSGVVSPMKFIYPNKPIELDVIKRYFKNEMLCGYLKNAARYKIIYED